MTSILPGDFFVGTQGGDLGHYRENGSFVELFNNTSGTFIDTVIGVAVDTTGNVYALAWDEGATGFDIYSINTSFAFVSVLSSNPFTDSQKVPGDIAILPNGHALVSIANRTAGTIELWEIAVPAGTVVNTWTGLNHDTGWAFTFSTNNWPKILVDCDGHTIYYTDLSKSIFRYDIQSSTQLADFMGLSGADATNYAYYAMTLLATGQVGVTLTRLDAPNSFGPIYGLAATSATRVWGDMLQVNRATGKWQARDFNPSTGGFGGNVIDLHPNASNARRSFISCMAAYYNACSVTPTARRIFGFITTPY